jgi:hypothetical protein
LSSNKMALTSNKTILLEVGNAFTNPWGQGIYPAFTPFHGTNHHPTTQPENTPL